MTDSLPFSPAAERNQAAILAQLEKRAPASGRVLEVASGTGQHAVFFASALPGLHWQPTDADPDALAAIDARTRAAGLSNTAAAARLDVCEGPWPEGPFHAIYCANMIHISPWATTRGLFDGAVRVLDTRATVFLYGPFLQDGVTTAPGNLAFDADLKARNPAWGIRNLADVNAVARETGFALESVVAMPANNLFVTFSR